jgi:opacity protein-like surface antigen
LWSGGRATAGDERKPPLADYQSAPRFIVRHNPLIFRARHPSALPTSPPISLGYPANDRDDDSQEISMRLPMLAVLLMGCGRSTSHAQNQETTPYSKIELFGGYTVNKFFYTDSGGESPANAASLFDFGWDRHRGLESSVIRNLNRRLGIKGDFSWYTSQTGGLASNGFTIQAPEKAVYFMAGPELKFPNRSRWTPFVHALAGVAHSWANLIVLLPNDAVNTIRQSHSRTGPSLALGGGLDYRVSKRLSFRLMTDYSATFLGNPDPEESGKQNNTRASLGLLFHFR